MMQYKECDLFLEDIILQILTIWKHNRTMEAQLNIENIFYAMYTKNGISKNSDSLPSRLRLVSTFSIACITL